MMSKVLECRDFSNTRELVTFVNSMNISREDIVTVLQNNGRLYLLYYYGESAE